MFVDLVDSSAFSSVLGLKEYADYVDSFHRVVRVQCEFFLSATCVESINEAAITNSLQLLRAWPHFGDGYLEFGKCLTEMGKEQEARNAFLHAERLGIAEAIACRGHASGELNFWGESSTPSGLRGAVRTPNRNRNLRPVFSATAAGHWPDFPRRSRWV